jgi:hypothetical protein
MAKINAKDWRNRATQDWTVTTFRQFLADEHERRYGIPYVARSFAIEGRWLKAMIAEHGAEVVRRFIEACFEEYRPTREYPGLNFGFMFSFQRARVLPRVLAEVKRMNETEERRQQAQVDVEDLTEWL